MATLTTRDGRLILALTRIEKIAAAHGNVEVPLTAVDQVEILDDAFRAVRGIRICGLRLRARTVAIGTFADGSWFRRTFAVVHRRPHRGVQIHLSGQKFGTFIVGCADPEAVHDRLHQATHPGE